MATVVIAKGSDPIVRTIQAIERCKPDLPPPEMGATILIKPNVVEPLPKQSGAVTRPEIIEGTIKFLLTHGKYRIIIGESSAVRNTEKCFKVAGYYYLRNKYPVEIIDFNKHAFIKIRYRDGIGWKQFELSKILLDCDYIISVPVLKEHAFIVTLGLKNLMGGLAPKGGYPTKAYMHAEYDDDLWANRLCDLLKVLKINLTIIDATTGMYGSHLYGRLKQYALTIVSEDPVAADIVGAKILGHSNVFYIRKAIERGIGSPPTKIISMKID